MKFKEISRLDNYLEHLQRVQKVSRTWNFKLSTISEALQKLNEARAIRLGS